MHDEAKNAAFREALTNSCTQAERLPFEIQQAIRQIAIETLEGSPMSLAQVRALYQITESIYARHKRQF